MVGTFRKALAAAVGLIAAGLGAAPPTNGTHSQLASVETRRKKATRTRGGMFPRFLPNTAHIGPGTPRGFDGTLRCIWPTLGDGIDERPNGWRYQRNRALRLRDRALRIRALRAKFA